MKIVIHTQYQENYSDVSGQYYWKSKGGSTYLVENVTFDSETCKVVEFDEVAPFIEINNEACINTIIGWEVLGDSEELGVDRWEQIEVFRKVGDQWTSSVTTDPENHSIRSEIIKLVRQWDLAADGSKSNYQADYHMIDGKVLRSDAEARTWFELNMEPA